MTVFLASLFVPTAAAADLVARADVLTRYACVQANVDRYYLPYANCVSSYDDNGAGDPVGYVCTRWPLGACLFQYPDGDGTTCVVPLKEDARGNVCVLSYTTWEAAGYDQFVCIG